MQNKRPLWSRFFKILAVLLPVCCLILFAPVSEFDDTRRTREFYLEEPHSLDVVVLGASDVYAGFSPVLAYEEYGYTSYNYALSGNFAALFHSQLEAIFEVQSPQLVVVEISEAVNADKGTNYNAIFRQYLAGLPFSSHKVQMIRRLGDSSQALSYYFPFANDHASTDLQTVIKNARSSYLTHKRGYSVLKGSLTFTGSGENWDGPYVVPINTTGDHSTAPIPEGTERAFHELLTQCRESGFDNLLFVNFPHRLSNEHRYHRYQYTNAVGEMIESYGYDFINLESMLDDIGIVPETDFYNNEHMNLYGQYKITRYLSRILTEEYGIVPQTQSPENRERWDICTEYRRQYEAIFDHEFKTREPEEFGLWMQEDSAFMPLLEERVQQARHSGK